MKSSPHATTVARRFSTKLRVQRATISSSLGVCNGLFEWIGQESSRSAIRVELAGDGSERREIRDRDPDLESIGRGRQRWPARHHSGLDPYCQSTPISGKSTDLAVTYTQTTRNCRSLYTEFRRKSPCHCSGMRTRFNEL